MRAGKPWTWLFILIVVGRLLPTFARRAYKKLNGKPKYVARSAPRVIPQKIWIYWDRGEENAPEIVKECIASWRAHNPGWDIQVLDSKTAAQIVELSHNPADLPVQSYADLLRLRLLRQQGGVWADATTYCLVPLDNWLPLAAQRGFFAFTWTKYDSWFLWPGMRRSMTNWFLASEPEGEFISLWEEASFGYWEGRSKPHIYYWPHIMIDYLYLTSRTFRRIYNEIPKISCYGPHLVHDCIASGHNPDDVAALLETGAAPVQKLGWKWNEDHFAQAKRILKIEEPR